MNSDYQEEPPLELDVPDSAMDDPAPVFAPEMTEVRRLVSIMEKKANSGDIIAAKSLIQLGIDLGREMDQRAFKMSGSRGRGWDTFAEASKDFVEFPVTVDDTEHEPSYWVRLLPVGENRRRAKKARTDPLRDWIRETVVLFDDVRRLGVDHDMAVQLGDRAQAVIELPPLTKDPEARSKWADALASQFVAEYPYHPDQPTPEWIIASEGLGKPERDKRTRLPQLRNELAQKKVELKRAKEYSTEHTLLTGEVEDLLERIAAAKVTKADKRGAIKRLIRGRLTKFV